MRALLLTLTLMVKMKMSQMRTKNMPTYTCLVRAIMSPLVTPPLTMNGLAKFFKGDEDPRVNVNDQFISILDPSLCRKVTDEGMK